MERFFVIVITLLFIGASWVWYENHQMEKELKAECEMYMDYYKAKSVFGGYVPDECAYLNK